MQVIEFPDSMDKLLGKVTMAYVSDLFLDTDRLRVMDALEFFANRCEPPALIHTISPLGIHWPQARKLLERGEIGLIVSMDVARDLLHEGIEPDFIALYGSDGFWDMIAEHAEQYDMKRGRFKAFVEAFGKHLAALRFFYGEGWYLMMYFRDYQHGLATRERVGDILVQLLLNTTVYNTYLGSRNPLSAVFLLMRRVNEVILEKIGDPVILLELDEPPRLRATITPKDESGTEELEEAYRELKLLHPKTVESHNEKTLIIHYLF